MRTLDSGHSNSLEFVVTGITHLAKEFAMARPASAHPTDGELEILRVLWERGPSALGDVCAALRRDREVATTTVATMLRVMLDKGLVRRKRDARGNRWSAAVSHAAAADSLVGKLVDGVFDGSAQRLVAHLVEGGRISAQELAELRALVHSGSDGSSAGRRDAKTSRKP
jgi:predicted transcriptional regulator